MLNFNILDQSSTSWYSEYDQKKRTQMILQTKFSDEIQNLNHLTAHSRIRSMLLYRFSLLSNPKYQFSEIRPKLFFIRKCLQFITYSHSDIKK